MNHPDGHWPLSGYLPVGIYLGLVCRVETAGGQNGARPFGRDLGCAGMKSSHIRRRTLFSHSPTPVSLLMKLQLLSKRKFTQGTLPGRGRFQKSWVKRWRRGAGKGDGWGDRLGMHRRATEQVRMGTQPPQRVG